MEELLSLKWNNHRSTFLHILGVLRDKQAYTDVTLACDGKFYSVHKLVLSTCSDYFCAMFDKTACKSPVIVLKDIKCEDLEALLDYMYLGEVNVRQSDLASLIKAAENLRIKGLAVPDDEPPKKAPAPSRPDISRREGGSGSPPSKRKRRDEGEDGRDDVRPPPSGLHTPPPQPMRPKSPVSQRLSPSPHRTSDSHAAEDRDSRPLSSPAVSPATSHTTTTITQSSSQQLSQVSQQQSSHQAPHQVGDPQVSQQQNVSNQYRGEETPTFVKVEMEDEDTGDLNRESYDISGDGYKEEDSGDLAGADLSNDLPEFLQQAASSALATTSTTYPPSFAGPSGFQPEVSAWQGDSQSLPGSFTGLNFPPSSQDNPPGTLLPQHQAPPQDQLHHHHQQQHQTQQLPNTPAIMPTLHDDSPVIFCRFCGKGFHGRYAKYNLKRHLMIHRGEKPFVCPYCPHRANQKGNMKYHILSVHPGKVSSEETVLPYLTETSPQNVNTA